MVVLNKRRSIAVKISIGLAAIILAVVVVSVAALFSVFNFEKTMSKLSDSSIPRITHGAELSSHVGRLRAETEKLAYANSNPVRRIAYANISEELQTIKSMIEMDEIFGEATSNNLEVLKNTLDEFNDLVGEKIRITNDTYKASHMLFKYMEDIIEFKENLKLGKLDAKSISTLSAWVSSNISIVNSISKSTSVKSLYKIKKLTKKLNNDLYDLKELSNGAPARLRTDLVKFHKRLDFFLNSDNGFLSLLSDKVKISLQSSARANFAINLLLDFQSSNTAIFNSMVADTSEEAETLTKRVDMLTWFLTIIFIIAVVFATIVSYYFWQNITVRLLELNKSILDRMTGDKELDIRISGNDEITDMAQSFIYYDEEVSRREQELSRIAMEDFLTGISNRRHFMELAERELQRSLRYNHKMCFLMVDIDHFKVINDTYGHHVGDIILKGFADVFTKELREVDLFGRLGGEEFGVVCVETVISEGEGICERLRKTIEDFHWLADGQSIKCTISIGVTELRGDDMSLSAVMKRADDALYNAKQSGRNRVVIS